MKVNEVHNRKDLRSFVWLPQTLFRNHAGYIPPLWSDEKKGYSAGHNPILAGSDYQLFLLKEDSGRAVGRIIAYIDHTFNHHYCSNIGFFGTFDCIEDIDAGSLLIKAAEQWLMDRGISVTRGPINPVAENWGFVLEGYEIPAVYLSPWNPPYYHEYFLACGYRKVKDLLAYEADLQRGYQLPARYRGLIERYKERFPDIQLRRLDLRRIKDDARAIWEISNIALADNWGYVPLDLAVMEDMLRKLKLIVDPDAIWIAEHQGRPVGYCLGFPDINCLIKKINGRLLPFGWARLLLGVRKLRDYRLFGLAVHPDWQGLALDALMYVNLYDNLAARKIRMEANYVLEDNLRIRNSLEKLGMRKIKTYRVYEKELKKDGHPDA